MGAGTVRYECHSALHLPPGRQWFGIGWAPQRGEGYLPPFNPSLGGGGRVWMDRWMVQEFGGQLPGT